MKNYKKVIALLMAASMTAGLAACGNNSDDGNNSQSGSNSVNSGNDAQQPGGDQNSEQDSETAGPYTIQVDENGNKIDLGGMEVIIRDWWTQGESEPTNGYEEAQATYRQWVQETYNFTCKSEAISGWGDVFTDLSDYVTTGGDAQNYVFTLRFAGELMSQMKQDLYYDLSQCSWVDMSGEKWDQTVKEFGTVNGKVYTMRKMSHEPRTGVYFNKRLLKENGIEPDEIYDLQKNHQWTWDKFVEYLAKLTKDTDGDGANDQWAFLEANSLMNVAVASNGGNYISKDASGKYVYTLENEEVLEAVNWAREITDLYNYPGEEGRNWDYFWDAFKAGNAVFMVQQEYAAGQNLSDMEDEFGFVAFPMGPKKSNYVDLMEDNVYIIPNCYDKDRANKIAFAYSMYNNPVPEYEDYSDYYAAGVSLFDERAAEETFPCMDEETVVMYHSFVEGIDLGNDFLWAINADNTPAAQAEVIRDSWQAYIDAANGN